MRPKIREVNLILGLTEFRNINLIAKGCYQLKIEAFTSSQSMILAYYSHEDLQGEKLELRQNYSTKVEFHSDDEKENEKQQSNKSLEESNKNTYFSLPFFVKYHCERVKLKSITLYSETTIEEMVDIKVTLLRKELRNAHDQELHEIQHLIFTVNCAEHYLEQKEILFPNPECCSFKLVILSCPLRFYDQIHSCSADIVKSTKIKKIEDKKEFLLEEIRKMIKKERYETFILKKELSEVLKNPTDEPIKLPLHFIEKENMSMDEVETNELKFFKYLAFYEKYYTSAEMLKEEMEHINVDKIAIIKNFIDEFEKENLILTVLEEKEKTLNQKKFKNFLMQTEAVCYLDKMISKYSHEEMKIKKSKIKQIDCIMLNSGFNDHIFENGFSIEKETKKQTINERSAVQYPLIFRDTLLIQKKEVERSDTLMICVLGKKIKKKKKFFIFSHGFQGLPIDLTFLINMIRFSNERIKTFVLKSYKNHMDESIEAMASRAAQEISDIFKKIDLNEIEPEITFIGHSMGPIIIRAALKQLSYLSEYFDSFVSICSPHLGYIQGTKFLTEAGLSILSKIKPIESLSQLSNRDNNDLEKTFIYKLSKEGSLRNFKKIFLIASMEDDYVPWHSARIEPFLQKGSKEKIEREMISHIFGLNFKETKIEKIERIEINFPHAKEKSLNSLIGRTCHIKPLSDRGFLEIFTKHLLPN